MGVDWVWSKTIAVMWTWEHLKFFLEHSNAFSPDALHVIVGVVLQLAAAIFLRTSISTWRPWGCVLTLAILNEFADLWLARWPQADIQYGESAKDMLLTMLLPTLLIFVARIFPEVLQRRT